MNGRKGLEPMVSAVLLVIAAVVGALALYLWFSQFAQQTTKKVSKLIESKVPSPEIQIVAVTYNSTEHEVTIYVLNTLNSPIKISSAYVIGANGLAICARTNVSTLVSPSQTINVTIPNCGLTSGSYQAKIVTSDGKIALYPFTIS